jgi:ADP-ribosylglycohydrolase
VFLQTLAAQAGSIRGLGPSTTGAIEHFRATGEIPISGGTTNGAPMRALPVGWATPLELPWHATVLLPDAALITATSSTLAAVRTSAI